MFSIIQAAGWPIWPLLACSILALALVVERLVSLRASKVTPIGTLEEALGLARHGSPSAEAIARLSQRGSLGEVLASGLHERQAHPQGSDEDLRACMQSSGREVAHELERYLSALATIASAAPLLGLLGTVIGMIEIFGAQAPASGAGAGNPAQLAHGISVALYNTAFGLIVAIPSLIFWRYFRARVDAYLLALELAAERLARLLSAERS